MLPRGPNFFVAYQWTRDRLANTETGLVPTVAERGGDLSGLLNSLGQPVTVYNPATGQPGHLHLYRHCDASLRYEHNLCPHIHGLGFRRFSDRRPVLGSHPIGSLSGQSYPSSLVRPDHLGFEPRVGVSWRPLPASTLVVRAGYGIYDDTSGYLRPA